MKKIGLWILVLLIVSSVAAYSPAFNPPNIVHAQTTSGLTDAWHFDESSGSALDSGPGSVTWVPLTDGLRVPGIAGNAAWFNGTGKTVYRTTKATDLAFSYRDNITLSIWIKPSDTSKAQFIFATDDVDYSTYATVYFFLESQHKGGQGPKNFVYFDWVNPGPSDQAVESTAPIPFGQWTHVAVVKQGASTLKLYINGALNNIASVSTTGTVTSRCQKWLGAIKEAVSACGSTGAYYFNGAMDEFLIYSRALSDQEIQNLFSSTATSTSTTTISTTSASSTTTSASSSTTTAITTTSTSCASSTVQTSTSSIQNTWQVIGSWSGSSSTNEPTFHASGNVRFNYTIHGINNFEIIVVRASDNRGMADFSAPQFSDSVILQLSGGDYYLIIDLNPPHIGWPTSNPGNMIWQITVESATTVTASASMTTYSCTTISGASSVTVTTNQTSQVASTTAQPAPSGWVGTSLALNVEPTLIRTDQTGGVSTAVLTGNLRVGGTAVGLCGKIVSLFFQGNKIGEATTYCTSFLPPEGAFYFEYAIPQLQQGTYPFSASFDGDSTYKSSSASATMAVSSNANNYVIHITVLVSAPVSDWIRTVLYDPQGNIIQSKIEAACGRFNCIGGYGTGPYDFSFVVVCTSSCSFRIHSVVLYEFAVGSEEVTWPGCADQTLNVVQDTSVNLYPAPWVVGCVGG